MPSDYEAITMHNERQLGLDTASRKTQICMYSDSTHFIYEILQNADDYGATEVLFKLTNDELLIEHNGTPFIKKNVEAITYFGKSTSRDDLVKEGRFGVGFKSVFAFTAIPVIISGDEHFQIYGLYRIREHRYPDGLSRSTTRIILPFNHESEQPDYVEDLMTKKDAYSKISARLAGLNMNTLLFTRNIREIRWEIDNRSGHYLREDNMDDIARWTSITDGEQLNKYLVFSRIPRWDNQEYKAVNIAFAANGDGQLSPVDDFLYVLFATTQETRLQFILNGPYRTNPSRETISEEDHFNRHLIDETCTLMKEVLPQLKEAGLLSTKFLSVLPNGNDKLRDFYVSILDVMVASFHDQELVPTDNNQFASADDVLQGPAPLRKVITKKELPFLSRRQNAYWAKGVQQNSRSDLFLRELNIKQWGWKQLQEILNYKYGDRVDYLRQYTGDDDDEWLAMREDSWLQKLYILLADAIRKDECTIWSLKNCRIIRVIEDDKESHVASSKAYFPKNRAYNDLPQIKRSILQGKNEKDRQKIEESLLALGVSKIGEKERIDLLLETFYSDSSVKINDKQHLQHVNTFIKWWKKEKKVRKFKKYSIFFVSGKDNTHKPADCFLDLPFEDTGLSNLFGCLAITFSKQMQPISKKYLKISNFEVFAKNVGVMHALEIREYYATKMQKYIFPVLGRRTTTTIDRDYYINGSYWQNKSSDYYLGEINLEMEQIELSLAVWKTMCQAEEKILSAYYYPNDTHRNEAKRAPSFLVNQLKSCAWVPDKDYCFQFPQDVTRESLHPDFPFDNRNGWLDAIGFGENTKRASENYKRRKEKASSLGVPMVLVDYLNDLPEEDRKKELKELKAYVKSKDEARKSTQRIQLETIPYHKALSKAFSKESVYTYSNIRGVGGSSRNPSLRRDRTSEDIAAAIDSEGKIEDRFSFALRKKWKGKNDQVRVALAEWYGGRCQICGNTFTQRSGEPYFEGLYLVPYTTAEWFDRVGNVLCLCPWHSAMFQFGPKEIDGDIIQQILHLKVQAEGGHDKPAIRMKLCGRLIEIEFAENHLIDLQEMIKMAQESVHK